MNTRRVVFVGAGAALSRHPDKFIVTVFEKKLVAGGMVNSMDVNSASCGASYIHQ